MVSFDYALPMYHAMQTKHIEPRWSKYKQRLKRSWSSPKLCINLPYVWWLGQCYSLDVDECHVNLSNRVHIQWLSRYNWPQQDEGIHCGGAQVIHWSSWLEQLDSNLFKQCNCYAWSAKWICSIVSSSVQARLLYSHSWPSPSRLEKEKIFKTLIIRDNWMCVYICKHHVTTALYCYNSLVMSWKVLLETTFACNFLMISCMLEFKDALEKMIIILRWNEYVSTLFNQQNSHHVHALAGKVRGTIYDNGFWQQCENFEYMLEPVLKALQVFEDSHLIWPRLS